jgi:broad specificity phosphatase PhoE
MRGNDCSGFERAFVHALALWIAGEVVGDDVEPYPDFVRRVTEGLARIVEAAPKGARIAVVTSGGPVGVLVQQALGVDANRGLELILAVHNAAFTELHATEGRLRLFQFNAVPHLEEHGLLTHV